MTEAPARAEEFRQRNLLLWGFGLVVLTALFPPLAALVLVAAAGVTRRSVRSIAEATLPALVLGLLVFLPLFWLSWLEWWRVLLP